MAGCSTPAIGACVLLCDPPRSITGPSKWVGRGQSGGGGHGHDRGQHRREALAGRCASQHPTHRQAGDHVRAELRDSRRPRLDDLERGGTTQGEARIVAMPPREVDQLIEALLDFSELVARLYAAAFFMVTGWRCPIESSVTSGVSYGVTDPGDPLKQRFSFGATYSATRRFLVNSRSPRMCHRLASCQQSMG